MLIVSPDEWATRALASVLEPAGYRVLRAATAADAREGARRAQPDVILIAAELEQPSGEELCRELRRDPAVSPATPILGVSAATVARERRLSWLRAGAWELLGFPLDGEELLLKLDGYVRAKREADRAGAGVLIDETTGLYNGRGLRRRAREVVAEALRLHHAPRSAPVSRRRSRPTGASRTRSPGGTELSSPCSPPRRTPSARSNSPGG
ncbi:MAG: hypothetical protein AUH07_09640 [Gemmatimonadetes bacterium 13_2_20CM_70_9]|nr:MAG: hypothetical protein AUH07_09640 [Gemmatimonadetes bacterium 13_2_20CM_70_9]